MQVRFPLVLVAALAAGPALAQQGLDAVTCAEYLRMKPAAQAKVAQRAARRAQQNYSSLKVTPDLIAMRMSRTCPTRSSMTLLEVVHQMAKGLEAPTVAREEQAPDQPPAEALEGAPATGTAAGETPTPEASSGETAPAPEAAPASGG